MTGMTPLFRCPCAGGTWERDASSTAPFLPLTHAPSYSLCVAEDGFGLLMLLPPPPGHWDHSGHHCVLPCMPSLSSFLPFFNFKRFIFINFTCLSVFLHLCLCTACVPGAHGGRERAWDSLELRYRWLQAIMWVLGIKPRSFTKATSALSHWANSLDPSCHFLLRGYIYTSMSLTCLFEYLVLKLSPSGPRAKGAWYDLPPNFTTIVLTGQLSGSLDTPVWPVCPQIWWSSSIVT